jgi:peptidoglycan/LPS O-acetylase OafA/YrhL/lysophospholipase L1-like esterase
VRVNAPTDVLADQGSASDETDEVLAGLRLRPIAAEALGYVDALDGLRAIALIAVLFYHARFPWMPGGFLGVSAFFTLSGFLITSLLLREWNREQSIDLRGFWVRRFRRLLPASWLVLGTVVALGAFGVWSSDQLRTLRGDVTAALLEVANIHFILADRTYGDLFTAPSPVEHYWSLAAEQQFYVVLPVLVTLVLSIGRHTRSPRRRLNTLILVLASLAVVSAALNGRLAHDSIDRAYFGTDTRMAEVLIGALLACVMMRRLRIGSAALRTAASGAGMVGLGGSIWLWHTAALDARWMYPWGLLLTAALTSLIVLGALQGGVFAKVLSSAPLRSIGRVSYGVYLLHWPVFLWLTPARVGWSQWPLFALRMSVTFVAAAAMLRLVETPIRTRRILRRRTVPVLAGVAAVLLAGIVVITLDVPAPSAVGRASLAESTYMESLASAPPDPVRAMVVGDEIGVSLSTAIAAMDEYEAIGVGVPGCGLSLGGWIARADNLAERDADRCGGVRQLWIAAAEEHQPDVVLVQGALRDLTDRRLDAAGWWGGPADPQIADFLVIEIGELVDDLKATGAEVVMLAVPYVRNSSVPAAIEDPAAPTPSGVERAEMSAGMPMSGFRENDADRVDRMNALLVDVARSRQVRFLDPDFLMEDWPGGRLDPTMRSDGVGFSASGGQAIGTWLLPQLRSAPAVVPRAETSPLLVSDAPLPPAPEAVERRSVPRGQRPTLLLMGDSVAFGLAFGLEGWAEPKAALRVETWARFGCPLARGGSYRVMREVHDFKPTCEWAETFPERVRAVDPDVVAFSSGIWEVVDRRFPGDERFRHIGDPGVDRYLLREFLNAIDVVASRGAKVVLLTQSYIEAGLDRGFQDLPESDKRRIDRLNQLMREAADLRPGVASIIDVQSWLAEQPGGELDPDKRPDGVHYTDEYARVIAAWLGPQLIQTARS